MTRKGPKSGQSGNPRREVRKKESLERHSTPRTASGGETAEAADASPLEVYPKGLRLGVQ